MVDCFRKIIRNEGYARVHPDSSSKHTHTGQIFEALPWYLRPHPHGGSQEVRLQIETKSSWARFDNVIQGYQVRGQRLVGCLLP